MELSPIFYHRLIRPRWVTKRFIHRKIENHISLYDKNVLDFGTGTGANCTLCTPGNYIGVDPDKNRIKFAKKFYPDYDFDVLQNNQLAIDDNSLDVILIIAVLHHIPSEQIRDYLREFRRVLRKTGGKVVVMEPCLFEKKHISNWFMQTNDNGNYILNEQGYYNLFKSEGFTCKTLEKFKKCFFYNELFFIAY